MCSTVRARTWGGSAGAPDTARSGAPALTERRDHFAETAAGQRADELSAATPPTFQLFSLVVLVLSHLERKEGWVPDRSEVLGLRGWEGYKKEEGSASSRIRFLLGKVPSLFQKVGHMWVRAAGFSVRVERGQGAEPASTANSSDWEVLVERSAIEWIRKPQTMVEAVRSEGVVADTVQQGCCVAVLCDEWDERADEASARLSVLCMVIQRACKALSIGLDGVRGAWQPCRGGGVVIAFGVSPSIGLDLARRVMMEAESKAMEVPADGSCRFKVGVDSGRVHVMSDIDGRPNVVGAPRLMAEALARIAAPGQVLGREHFADKGQADASKLRFLESGDCVVAYNLSASAKGTRDARRRGLLANIDLMGPLALPTKVFKAQMAEAKNVGDAALIVLLSRLLLDIGAIGADQLRNYAKDASRGRRDLPGSFLAGFDPGTLTQIMRQGEWLRLKAGDQLCKIDEEARSLYVIAGGTLSVVEDELSRTAGDIVGEMALIEPGTMKFPAGNKRRTRTLKAKEAAMVFAVPYATFTNSAKKDVAKAFKSMYRERKIDSASGYFKEISSEEREQLATFGRHIAVASGNSHEKPLLPLAVVACCFGDATLTRDRRAIKLSEGQVCSMGNAHPSEVTITAGSGHCELVIFDQGDWVSWLSGKQERLLSEAVKSDQEPIVSRDSRPAHWKSLASSRKRRRV